ncbi:MAG: hypothetical protein MAG451_01817 [Anaerolineales bacterium]|nr:hypothetical protein [Anaerolineales bacterium]
MSLYDRLIAEIFHRHDGPNHDEFEFDREEMREILEEWGETVRNLGDVPYSYRGGRRPFPEEITATGNWVIEGRGRGRYAFRRLARSPYISVPSDLQTINILDATPDIILKYGSTDEQGLLAKVRYNRLIDTFLGITAYHLQGHLRAYIAESGQIEIDDLYLGVDTDGTQFVIPVEAKTEAESLGVIQVVNLNAFGRENYPQLTLRSVAVKAWEDGTIYCIQFNGAVDSDGIEVIKYKRYRLIREEALARRVGILHAGESQ